MTISRNKREGVFMPGRRIMFKLNMKLPNIRTGKGAGLGITRLAKIGTVCWAYKLNFGSKMKMKIAEYYGN